MSFLVKMLKCAPLVKKIQLKYYSMSIIGDRITELNEETLTGRLLLYLNTYKYQETNKVDVLKILKSKNLNNLRKCDTELIITAIYLMKNRHHVSDKGEAVKLLNILDLEYCRRMDQLETKDILDILHGFMNTVPNRITEYNFYTVAVQELLNKADTLSKNNLVQLIFYISLQKKIDASHYMLRICMQYLYKYFVHLSTEDLCIVCNSVFKTSTKINNRAFLDKVITYLSDNLCVLKDSAFFITLIKPLRHHRYQNEDLLATISCTIFFNKTLHYYSFSALCHILALYSDYLYYDENLIKVFTERCIMLLSDEEYTTKHAYHQDQPRLKDIKRMLWCLSNLNYRNIDLIHIKQVIIPSILMRIRSGDVGSDHMSVIEIILYLWMLDYRAYELMPYALTKENINAIRAFGSPKNYRLNQLLSCIYFEDRKLFRDLKVHPQHSEQYEIKYQLDKRPLLQKIIDSLRSVSAQHGVNKFEIGCQIPGLNIIGITGFRKKIYKSVHIEVLDEYTTMKNVKDMPTGMMQLKLRILEGFEEGLIMIYADEVELLDDDELQKFLLDEIDMVC